MRNLGEGDGESRRPNRVGVGVGLGGRTTLTVTDQRERYQGRVVRGLAASGGRQNQDVKEAEKICREN